MTTENKPKTVSEIFETSPCSRCGGAGQYSYCQMYGTRCFGCGGQKVKFTKHGQANYDAWRAAVDAATLRPVAELKVGDAAKIAKDQRRYARVAAISEVHDSTWGRIIDGVTIRYPSVTITFDREVMFDSPMGSHKVTTYEVVCSEPIRIHPGNENMPKAEAFVTEAKRRKVKA